MSIVHKSMGRWKTLSVDANGDPIQEWERLPHSCGAAYGHSSADWLAVDCIECIAKANPDEKSQSADDQTHER